jgi:Uma2 family endonuclease
VVRWTKARYLAAVDYDPALFPKRSFLFRGELIEMPPMKEPHAHGVMRVNYWVTSSFRPRFHVRIQMPLDVPGDSVPEPDVLVCRPDQIRRNTAPTSGVLVIEVSDSSVSLDRAKADEYSAAGIPEYWLLNLKTRRLELHRDPAQDPETPTGWRYASIHQLSESDAVSPLFSPETSVRVSELLPEPDAPDEQT